MRRAGSVAVAAALSLAAAGCLPPPPAADPPSYSVPADGGDSDTALRPETVAARAPFDAKRGHFFVPSPGLPAGPRLTGVIPVGWRTVGVPNPPEGAVGAITPGDGLLGAAGGYRPHVLLTASLAEDSDPARAVRDWHGGSPGARWRAVRSGTLPGGRPTRLLHGDWEIGGVRITGRALVVAADAGGGDSVVFAVIMSVADGVPRPVNWEFQTNVIVNSVAVSDPPASPAG